MMLLTVGTDTGAVIDPATAGRSVLGKDRMTFSVGIGTTLGGVNGGDTGTASGVGRVGTG